MSVCARNGYVAIRSFLLHNYDTHALVPVAIALFTIFFASTSGKAGVFKYAAPMGVSLAGRNARENARAS